MVLDDFHSLSALSYPQLSFRVMQLSRAAPFPDAAILCSGVEKSSGKRFLLFTRMSGCNSNIILSSRSDSHPAALNGNDPSYHSMAKTL
jgi:hypothetical protein